MGNRFLGRRGWLLGAALVMVCACHDNEDASTCLTDDDGGDGGTCLSAPTSFLTFCTEPAGGCPLGRRWAASAGDELAGLCVGAIVDAASADAASPDAVTATDADPGDVIDAEASP